MNEDSNLQIEEPPSQTRRSGNVFYTYIRPCVAEMVATMSLVFVDVCGERIHGFTLFVLVAATANISGGHLNPAVTLALTIVIRGLQPIILAPLYVFAQLLGGIIGAALAKAAMPRQMYYDKKGGVYMLDRHVNRFGETLAVVSPGEAILAEAVATSILVFAVLMVAFDRNNKSVLAPLAIGFAALGGEAAVSRISGGSMNPARSFGPAVVKGLKGNYWKYHYVYWIGPILGSLFSTLMYRLFFASPNRS